MGLNLVCEIGCKSKMELVFYTTETEDRKITHSCGANEQVLKGQHIIGRGGDCGSFNSLKEEENVFFTPGNTS